jgi:hypothetical protein
MTAQSEKRYFPEFIMLMTLRFTAPYVYNPLAMIVPLFIIYFKYNNLYKISYSGCIRNILSNIAGISAYPYIQ